MILIRRPLAVLRVSFLYEREFRSADHTASSFSSGKHLLVVYRGPRRTTKYTILWSAATDCSFVYNRWARYRRYSGVTEGLLCIDNILLLRLQV